MSSKKGLSQALSLGIVPSLLTDPCERNSRTRLLKNIIHKTAEELTVNVHIDFRLRQRIEFKKFVKALQRKALALTPTIEPFEQ